MIKLKACPFCGNSTPRIVRAGTARRSTQIECGWCGCRHESGDEGDRVGASWNERSAPDTAAQVLSSCPACETGTLTPELYTDTLGAVTVVGLERSRCDTCKAAPILADQIKRNQVRLGAAREAHAKDTGPASAEGNSTADERDRGPWLVSNPRGTKVVLQSNDFHHDVALEITGDFVDVDSKVRYAQWLAQRLSMTCAQAAGGVEPARLNTEETTNLREQ